MERQLAICLTLVSACLSSAVLADPAADRAAFEAYYRDRFPDVPFSEFANGIYAIDDDARSQWVDIEAFPPYEFAIEAGETEWQAELVNGKSYADCFDIPVDDIRPQYPQYDAERGEVVTLDVAVNDCRLALGVAALDYGSEAIINLTAYLAYEARGKVVATRVPEDDPGALAAYEAGKRFYYTKRGQLNFACYDCHVLSVGQYVRADRLGPSLGHPTHFPVYRSKLGGMITLQQRFYGCVRDVRAKPFDLQSTEFRNLEYFLSYMSNGLEFNGPGARK
jgi:sulfur-oxidizing protein SoxA